MTPAMQTMPPLQIAPQSSAQSSAGGSSNGAATGMNQGDWNVNFGDGSIATSKGMNMYLMAGIGLVALWIIRRKP